MPKSTIETGVRPERAILVGVEARGGRGLWSIDDSLEELGLLARTAGAVVVTTLSQRLDRRSNTYLGKGKLEGAEDAARRHRGGRGHLRRRAHSHAAAEP